jgi:hypothetical protein
LRGICIVCSLGQSTFWRLLLLPKKCEFFVGNFIYTGLIFYAILRHSVSFCDIRILSRRVQLDILYLFISKQTWIRMYLNCPSGSMLTSATFTRSDMTFV